MTPKMQLGRRGERHAWRYLRRRGYSYVCRNWQSERYEIDLIGWDRSTLVFIEVKTRREGAAVGGYASVNERKRRALRRAVKRYLRGMRPQPESFRFDVVEVWLCNSGKMRVNHIPNIPLFPDGHQLQTQLWALPTDIRFSRD